MSTFTQTQLDRLILESAREANVLPITSRCDSHCVFCSHKNNPPGVRVFSTGVRSLQDVARTMAFLDPARAITIGESATAIIEGEPLSHPDFREILLLLRRAFPDTPVEITTNARRLSSEIVRFLGGLESILLHVSLNSASVGGRKLLMGDSAGEAEQTLAGVRLLGESGVRFDGSLVAMPNLVGWEDIGETVDFLGAVGARTVRVIAPAYSSRADARLFPDPDSLRGQIREFIGSLPADLPCPVLAEPSCVMDLTPVVSGVFRGSPAAKAGVSRGDVVLSVNGRQPRCRVEAWRLLSAGGDLVVDLVQPGGRARVRWANLPGVDPGVTMEYDFDPARMDKVAAALLRSPGRVLLLTSLLGHTVVTRVLELLGFDGERAVPLLVENRTFGGTIGAAGLLTVDDYNDAFWAWHRPGSEVSSIILPLESFDAGGMDLKGRHYSDLFRLTGVPVLLL